MNKKNNNVCLVSITASHYRRRIYQLLDEHLDCDFFFGKSDTTVKQLDFNCLSKAVSINNKKLGSSNWYFQPNITKHLKSYKIIIDDLGVFCLSSWLNMILSKFRRQKVFTWSHGWYGREDFVKKWMKRLYFGLADGTFLYGNYARQLMIENGFKADKLHVIHNSLDYDEQLKLRNQMMKSEIYHIHFHNDNPVLCFIGRLTKVKRLDLLVQALAIMKQKDILANLVLIGGGEQKEELLSVVDSYGLKDQVWFYGACYEEKTNAELIYNADLCVAPGNIGLTAMHAMMFGCPCISHNDFPWQMPEFEAIKPGQTGDFFERDNVQSLADIIQKWFMDKKDKREEVRQACFDEIDNNWNPHRQIEVIKSVLYKK